VQSSVRASTQKLFCVESGDFQLFGSGKKGNGSLTWVFLPAVSQRCSIINQWIDCFEGVLSDLKRGSFEGCVGFSLVTRKKVLEVREKIQLQVPD